MGYRYLIRGGYSCLKKRKKKKKEVHIKWRWREIRGVWNWARLFRGTVQLSSSWKLRQTFILRRLEKRFSEKSSSGWAYV